MMNRLMVVIFLLGASACSGVVKTSWQDDYAQNKWRGGLVEYERESSQWARNRAKYNATKEAQKWCGEKRKPFLTPMKPVKRLERKTGFLIGPYLEDTWFERHQFLCADSDPVVEFFTVDFVNGPRCKPVEAMLNPGLERYDALRKKYSVEICDAQGWIRVPVRTGVEHLFMGTDGLSVCKKLMSEITAEQDEKAKVEAWLHERLLCPAPVACKR